MVNQEVYKDPITGEESEVIDWSLKNDTSKDQSSQNLDSILDFDFASQDSANREGLRALIDSSLVPLHRMPALEAIFDRASRYITKSLRNLAHDALDVTVDNVTMIRFRDYLEDDDASQVIGLMRSPSIDQYIIVNVDTPFVGSMVDFLLGGHCTYPLVEANRQFTSIELTLTERIIQYLSSDLSLAFSNLKIEPFKLEKLEVNKRFVKITNDSSLCVLAKLKVNMGEATGRINVVIPYMALEPYRLKLINEYDQENQNQDSIWKNYLANEIGITQINLQMVLGQKTLTLGEISNLHEGQLLMFGKPDEQKIKVKSGPVCIATAHLGRAGDQVAVKLDSDIAGQERRDTEGRAS